jgi:O-antigen/teichoic acid export membrane protein
MLNIFGNRKLVRDLSANALHTAIAQFFPLLIFYFTSKYLAKEDFGELNWCTAVGATLMALASLGLDVVLVKRIASGQNALLNSRLHLFHSLAAGIALTAAVFAAMRLFPLVARAHPLFFLVFVNLALSGVANSFRLTLTGLEGFRSLVVLSLTTNVLRLALILGLYVQSHLTVRSVVSAFIISSALDLLLGYFVVSSRLRTLVRPACDRREYSHFVVESLPQLANVVFESALARMDWILLGVLSTASATAEYSFAYRMYEGSKLPVLVVGPIILTRFSRLFSQPGRIDDELREDIRHFFRLALFVVMLIPVALICTWSPLMGYLSNNKYGHVNELTYLILAACVPLHCISNFLWSMGVAQGQLKQIMYITAPVVVLNTLLNCLLIPFFAGPGAATAFLVSTVVQTILYAVTIRQTHVRLDVLNCVKAFTNAIVSVWVARTLSDDPRVSVSLALALYATLALFSKQIDVRRRRIDTAGLLNR